MIITSPGDRCRELVKQRNLVKTNSVKYADEYNGWWKLDGIFNHVRRNFCLVTRVWNSIKGRNLVKTAALEQTVIVFENIHTIWNLF
jgi:hypothetical protein